MDRDQVDSLSLLAYVLMQNGRPGKAATVLEALDLLAPDDPRTLLSLAVAQLRSGKSEEALETLNRRALTGAADAHAHLVRAQALQALGRHDEAAHVMRVFLSLREASQATPGG